MKTMFAVLALVSATALGAESNHARKISSAKPVSVKPGHFFCGETETNKGIEGVQDVLESSCDATKSYTVTVYSDSAAYANYGFCCIHK